MIRYVYISSKMNIGSHKPRLHWTSWLMWTSWMSCISILQFALYIYTIYLASLMHASTAWYVCWVVALSLLVADGCPSVVDSSCSKGNTIVWPETEIGETVTVSCPCGSPRSSLLLALKATRSCGGNYNNGAQWEDAFCRDCQFHDSRLMLCKLSQVSTT